VRRLTSANQRKKKILASRAAHSFARCEIDLDTRIAAVAIAGARCIQVPAAIRPPPFCPISLRRDMHKTQNAIPPSRFRTLPNAVFNPFHHSSCWPVAATKLASVDVLERCSLLCPMIRTLAAGHLSESRPRRWPTGVSGFATSIESHLATEIKRQLISGKPRLTVVGSSTATSLVPPRTLGNTAALSGSSRCDTRFG